MRWTSRYTPGYSCFYRADGPIGSRGTLDLQCKNVTVSKNTDFYCSFKVQFVNLHNVRTNCVALNSDG